MKSLVESLNEGLFDVFRRSSSKKERKPFDKSLTCQSQARQQYYYEFESTNDVLKKLGNPGDAQIYLKYDVALDELKNTKLFRNITLTRSVAAYTNVNEFVSVLMINGKELFVIIAVDSKRDTFIWWDYSVDNNELNNTLDSLDFTNISNINNMKKRSLLEYAADFITTQCQMEEFDGDIMICGDLYDQCGYDENGFYKLVQNLM